MELPAASHQDWSRRLAQPVPVDMRRELLAHSAFLPFPNLARKDLPTMPTVTGLLTSRTPRLAWPGLLEPLMGRA